MADADFPEDVPLCVGVGNVVDVFAKKVTGQRRGCFAIVIFSTTWPHSLRDQPCPNCVLCNVHVLGIGGVENFRCVVEFRSNNFLLIPIFASSVATLRQTMRNALLSALPNLGLQQVCYNMPGTAIVDAGHVEVATSIGILLCGPF